MFDKHLIVLGIRGLPASHGGFESFAEKLAPWMLNAGWRVTVYCQGSDNGKRTVDTWQGCQRVHIPVHGDNAFSTIEFDIKSTVDAIKNPGIILTLGYNTGFLAIYSRIMKKTNLINMDGIEWKREKYSLFEKIYLWLNELIASKFGNTLIADHPEIALHLMRHTSSSKIETIAYGSDRLSDEDPSCLNEFGLEKDKYLTLIARPEPENSILEIVTAFSQKERGVRLLVLGNYREDQAYHVLVRKAASREVIFAGAVYEKIKIRAIRRFSLAYLHGHRVGGTNPSLVEALGAGNAIIAHDNKFNRWVAGESALYFSNEDECSSKIDEVISNNMIRENCRNAALQRWSDEFMWPSILSKYENLLEKSWQDHITF